MAFVFAGHFGPQELLNASAVLLKSTPVKVYLTGTTTLATLYTDRTKATAAANPVPTDALGNLSFYADPGDYDITTTTQVVTVSVPVDPAEVATAFAAGVISFKARTGVVVPAAGDYLAVPTGGLTGAVTATRFVGGTAGGAPVSGTFAVGDFAIDVSGKVWICTAAGTPGTWVTPGATGQASGDLAGAYPSPTLANPLAALVAAYNRTGVVSGCTVAQHSAGSAPTYVTQAHAEFANGTNSLTIPASVQVGDQMLFMVEMVGSGGSASDPSGWTFVDDALSPSSAGVTSHLRLWRKTAVSGDTGGAATVTSIVGNWCVLALVVYRGVSSATPVNVEAKQNSPSDGTTITAPSVTTTVANCLVVSIFGGCAPTGGAGPTLSALPTTNRLNFTSTGHEASIAVSDAVLANPGATSATTATAAPASSWQGITVALAPTAALANMTVDMAPGGTVVVNGATVAVAAAYGVLIAAADATNPRLDLVTVDSGGTIAVVAGTPAAVPAYPSVPPSKALLAVVAVAANVTSILNANITDLRIILGIGGKQAAITTPNAQTASYVQADVTSLKTAIDAIRTALTAAGITL